MEEYFNYLCDAALPVVVYFVFSSVFAPLAVFTVSYFLRPRDI